MIELISVLWRLHPLFIVQDRNVKKLFGCAYHCLPGKMPVNTRVCNIETREQNEQSRAIYESEDFVALEKSMRQENDSIIVLVIMCR